MKTHGLVISLLLALSSCVIAPDQSPGPDAGSDAGHPSKLPVGAQTLQLAPAAAGALHGAVYDASRRVIRAVEPVARIHFSLPLVERSCIFTVQVTEIPGAGSQITLFGQEEVTLFLEESVVTTGSTWTRTRIQLDPPHEVIDESAYTLEWMAVTPAGTDPVAELGQVQVVYEPGPGCSSSR